MIEFKISGKKYQINDVTIQQYYDIQDLIVRTDLASKIEIVSRIAECDLTELKKLDKHQFIAIWDALVENYLNLEENTPFHRTFVHKEEYYGFLDMTKITLAEFADMDVLRADPQSSKKLHMMMAILYRKATPITDNWIVTEPYNSDTLMQRADQFLNLPLKYVTGALNFFSAVSKFYVETILNSLTQDPKIKMTLRQKTMIDLVNQIMQESQEIGARSFSSVQETILPKLEQLSKLALLESSTTSHTENKSNKKKTSFVERMKRLTSKNKHIQ